MEASSKLKKNYFTEHSPRGEKKSCIHPACSIVKVLGCVKTAVSLTCREEQNLLFQHFNYMLYLGRKFFHFLKIGLIFVKLLN